MRTHFADIDYPTQTLSPSTRERTADGWKLRWRFEQIVSGFGIGMVTPQRVQPGELVSSLAFSAPISLFFFFLVLYVLSTLRRIEIHPINYFFLAGAFYAFHLLFAYSADHLDLELAFALCSCVSVALVVSYLRLVVSPRFALREAALAQIVYLIGFSLAHFWEGFTGLTVTVLAILTLFVLMQLTGRVRWSDALAAPAQARPA
jgi:inner membrane protein involved in colicin E2 resistance